jgi:hypothetical protein
MHEVFAAVRLWQLMTRMGLKRHAKVNGERLFGSARWNEVIGATDWELDEREQLLQFAFAVLHSGKFFDDPSDDVRTISNMEMATIVYVDEQLPKMDNWPIWVADKKDPNCLVGVEQVFDVVLYYEDGRAIRFAGTIDGLVLDLHRGGRPTLDENKTASRLDDGWIMSFDMSHQVTGYLTAASTYFGFGIAHSRIQGLKVKPSGRGDDKYVKVVSRTADSVRTWAAWFRHTVELFEAYKDDWEHAPRYTHSCNRYFRPCSLVQFCGDTPDGRIEQWASMEKPPGSPTEQAIAGERSVREL